MHRVPRLSLALLVAAFAAAPAHALTSTSHGTPADYLRQPLSSPRARTGVRSAAPSANALAATVAQMTGLAPSALATVDSCPPVSQGLARCAAQALVLRSGRRLVHPRVARGASAGANSAAAAATPPQAGTPAYLQQAYDTAYLSQAGGAGATVAIIDAYDDPKGESDLGVYRSTYGLGPCTTQNGCFTKVNQSGASSPLPMGDGGWSQEISLDLDAASALCPRCHLLLVEASSNSVADLNAAMLTAVSLGATQISDSWTATLGYVPSGTFTFPGVPVVAASGDHGYVGSGLANYPAAFAGVTSAGGTSLAQATGGQSARGYNESAWSLDSSGWGAGSGCNLQEPKPAYQTDGGCAGRSYADLSADSDPDTGLRIYDSISGGWLLMGGTSLATPLIASYYAITGVAASTPGWAYADSALLNDPASGSVGTCPQGLGYLCNAGVGYDGPTGIGSISGAVVNGAPGIGGPGFGSTTGNTYTQAVTPAGASLAGGVEPNGLGTTYWWEYGADAAYGQHSMPVDIGQGQAPVPITSTLSGLHPDTTYHYRLVAQNSLGTSYGYDYTLTTTGPVPVNTSPPVVSGVARQGQTLGASPGSWNPAGTSYAYEWQRDSGSGFSNITGGATYILQGADIGASVRVVVTATNRDGQASATSSAVGPVLSGAPANTTAPTLSGSPQRGSTLTVNAGAWSPAAYSFTLQWQRDPGTGFQNVPGAAGSSYVLAKADEGANIRVVVTAVNAYGTASATTGATGPVQAVPPVNTVPPGISGTAQRASTLSASAGSWTGAGNSYSYQWQRDNGGFQDVAGATAATYSLGTVDEGAPLRVIVTATNPDGVISQTSAPSQPVASAPPSGIAPPSINGLAQRAITLSASTGSWAGAGNSYSYQWQRNTGSGFQDVAGATTSTYSLGAGDESATIRVVVTAGNADTVDGVSQASAASATVLPAPPVNTAPPTIGGAPRLNVTLTVNGGSWHPVDSILTYDWQRGDAVNGYQDIAGATTTAYTLRSADVGKPVRVIVTATNVDGAKTATTAPTEIVSQPPQNITPPAAPSGTLMDTYTLTADNGTWDTPGPVFSYVWLRCDAGAASVTSSCGQVASGTPTYMLTAVDVGRTIAVRVTATSAGGPTSVTSALTGTVIGRPLANVTPPSIAGNPQIPQGLAADPGTWNVPVTGVSFSWYRCDLDGVSSCVTVSTNSQSYRLSGADRGHTVMVVARATSPGRTASAASQAVTVHDQPLPQATAAPTVTGIPMRLSWLLTSTGIWTGSPTLSYQWLRCAAGGGGCQPIAGANGTSYQLTHADEGDAITIEVTATNSSGSVNANAGPTAPVGALPPVNTHGPVIQGIAQQGLLLLISRVTWQATSDTAYSYAWQRCSAGGAACQMIGGATGLWYSLAAADVGHTLVGIAAATNPDGTRTIVSAPSAVVLPAPPRWLTLPGVSPDPGHVGDVLGFTPATWSGLQITSDTTQWMRCTNICVAAGPPNAAHYTITSIDVGSGLRIKETVSNASGSATAWSANYVWAVDGAASATAVLGARPAALRTARGAVLAMARLAVLAVADAVRSVVSARPSRGVGAAQIVVLARGRGVHGPLRAWACPLSGKRGGPPPACTAPTSLRSSATLKLPAGSAGRVRVVVVRRR